ncbi:hypothetical protein JYU34_005798, partial [Plutella xylostella]
HYKGRGGSLGSHDQTDDQPVQGHFNQQSHCSFGASTRSKAAGSAASEGINHRS